MVHIIRELRQKYPLKILLDFAKIPKSTFYYHLNKKERKCPYSAVKDKIIYFFNLHKGRYGYRRITALLKQHFTINHKTVAKIMRNLGLRSHVRKKKFTSYKVKAANPNIPNILNRQFLSTAPHQKWVTDVTEFNINGEKVFLSVVLDLFNREIIDYNIEFRPTLALVYTNLTSAIHSINEKSNLLIHSDQGWQYRHQDYVSLLKNNNITQSMSRKATCLDNAVVENFFGILKTEFFHHQSFESRRHFLDELKKYLQYYNTSRISLKLKGMSPVDYRTHCLTSYH